MQRVLMIVVGLSLAACAKPSPTCTDGARNGQEADVDCGGPDCARCGHQRACETHDDCASGVCRLHTCAMAPPAGACRRNAECAPGACLDGVCVPPCAQPLVPCGAACVDLRYDPMSCGACGRACAAGERCEGGSCLALCPPGTMPCGSGPSLTCVDVRFDVLHCGSCTTVCGPHERCNAGACQPDCAPFQALCGTQCVSTMTDVLHCGGCGLPCDVGEVCSMATCQAGCTAPAVACDGGATCVDVRFDPGNCGACGAACPPVPNAGPLCLDRICTRTRCNPGFEDCNGLPFDGCEAELAVDAMNCGVCGRSCDGPCLNGSCP